MSKKFEPTPRSSAAFHSSYMAFFADCEHEVLPVTHGYRLCPTYNLVYTGGGSPPNLPDAMALEPVVRALEAWRGDPQGPLKLLIPLSHLYTVEGLSCDLLKSGDRSATTTLIAAARRTNIMIHLGQLGGYESSYDTISGTKKRRGGVMDYSGCRFELNKKGVSVEHVKSIEGEGGGVGDVKILRDMKVEERSWWVGIWMTSWTKGVLLMKGIWEMNKPR